MTTIIKQFTNPLTNFAKKSYKENGRGIIFCRAYNAFSYVKLDSFKKILENPANNDHELNQKIVEFCETYDPNHSFVYVQTKQKPNGKIHTSVEIVMFKSTFMSL